MSEVTTIDRLVEASEAATLTVREKQGVLPTQASETFARHADELRKTGRSFEKFQKKEKFGKYLNILANFPILKTEPLLLLQDVTLEMRNRGFSCTARLPLFGIAPWESSPFLMNVEVSRNSLRVEFAGCDKELPQKDSYLRLLRGGFGAIAGQLCGYGMNLRMYQSKPGAPKKVNQTRNEADVFGFTGLAVVWGPAKYTLEEVPFKQDPLLIGKMFDTWWILDQWDVTDSEKRLIPTDKD